MCGIAGFSLSPNEALVVSPRKIAKAMLLSIESRGRDATGFAFIDGTGSIQVHKDDIDATSFVKRRLCVPRTADTLIMHTRWATQGDPKWNVNNHPILTGGIVGVHNGHVSNDDSIFRDLAKENGEDVRIGQVDSEAIFAALAYTVGNTPIPVLETIMGGAAVAWLDENDEIPNRLHLARIKNSPLVVGETKGGSLLFASTQEAVVAGARAGRMRLDMIRHLSEGKYITVNQGTYEDVQEFDVPSYNRSNYYKTSATVYGTSSVRQYGWDEDEYETWGETAGRVYPHPAMRQLTPATSLNEKLDAEEADVMEEINSSGWTDDEREKYLDWWRANTKSLDEAIAVDDLKEKRDKAHREQEWDAFVKAPRLNSFYLTHPHAPMHKMSDSEYLCDKGHAKREAIIETWLSRVKCQTEDAKTKLAYNLRAHVRPGDGVVTQLNGQLAYGTLHTVPDVFPGGPYMLRLFLTHKRRPQGVEAVFVMREYYEFDLAPPLVQDVEDAIDEMEADLDSTELVSE